MFLVPCLGISWRHDIWISENLKVDYLKNEKSFWSETKKIFSLVSQDLSFRHRKQTSKNVGDTTLKLWQIKELYSNIACFSSKAFLTLLKLLTFTLAVLQIFDTCVSNVRLWSIVILKGLTQLILVEIFQFLFLKACVYQARYTEISQDLSLFDCSKPL